jgi:LmbE family N-acetylglucosaminyl deacetylase
MEPGALRPPLAGDDRHLKNDVRAILIVSPHLDDAVLSLGGTIARWCDEGARVVVATVYTAGPPIEEVARSMRPFADYEVRRREDTEALSVLGAEWRWLGHVERAFRAPPLTGLAIFTTPATRDHFGRVTEIAATLDALDVEPDLIAVPLGIGNHVDHVETLIATSDWLLARGLAERAVFYEDPYAVSGAMRRAHFLARRSRWPPWRAPLLRAPRLALLLRAAAFARRGPPLETYLAAPWRAAGWRVEASRIAAYEGRKLEAVERYRSQVRAFGGMSGVARALRAYHLRSGGEPLWRAELASAVP